MQLEYVFNTLTTFIIFLLLTCLYCYRSYRSKRADPPLQWCQAYILHNSVTHSRFFPVQSKHAFTYRTFSLLVSLNALEKGRLNFGRGLLFACGKTFGRLTAIYPDGYLQGPFAKKSIQGRLRCILSQHQHSESLFEDAWMMTMPAFLGFEGINPLTVYFCYKKTGQLWIVILEVHNTFGEAHVYVLEVGKDEDDIFMLQKEYDSQWTFPRAFHVSPFNDRNGVYTVSIKAPSHPPFRATVSPIFPAVDAPRPSVRIRLHMPSTTQSPSSPHVSRGDLKLTALLRCTTSTPLTSANLLRTMYHMPFALLLTMPRILYQAYILHYVKRLNVYIRPEPFPARQISCSSEFSGKASHLDAHTSELHRNLNGGTKWQAEGPLEIFVRRRIVGFFIARMTETRIGVTLVPGDHSVPVTRYLPEDQTGAKQHAVIDDRPIRHLEILYLSSQFFTTCFMTPSAGHAHLLGCETNKNFTPSSRDLFIELLTIPRKPFSDMLQANLGTKGPLIHQVTGNILKLTQRLRMQSLPHSLRTAPSLPISLIHPMDAHTAYVFGISGALLNLLLVVAFLLAAQIEKFTFMALGARFVPGDEPWLEWQRAEDLMMERKSEDARERPAIGSLYSPR